MPFRSFRNLLHQMQSYAFVTFADYSLISFSEVRKQARPRIETCVDKKAKTSSCKHQLEKGDRKFGFQVKLMFLSTLEEIVQLLPNQ